MQMRSASWRRSARRHGPTHVTSESCGASRKYEALSTDPPPEDWFTFAAEYDTPDYRAAYATGEDASFLQFVGLAGDGMSPQIDLRALGPQFAMPVYLIQGEQDLVTPAHISKAYFDGSFCTEQGMSPAATHRTRFPSADDGRTAERADQDPCSGAGQRCALEHARRPLNDDVTRIAYEIQRKKAGFRRLFLSSTTQGVTAPWLLQPRARR